MKNIKKELFKPGPLHDYRHLINAELKVIVKTGDLFFRLGRQSFLGIPFEKLVAKLTHSKYSHASVAIVENDEIYLVEVNDFGTTKIGLKDWCGFANTTDVSVWRLDLKEYQIKSLTDAITKFVEDDPDYDFTFDSENKFYCTESVCYLFKQANIALAQPSYLKEMTTKRQYFLISVISWFVKLFTGKGIPTKSPLYFVGNKEKGIMSTKGLTKVWST